MYISAAIVSLYGSSGNNRSSDTQLLICVTQAQSCVIAGLLSDGDRQPLLQNYEAQAGSNPKTSVSVVSTLDVKTR